MSLLETLMSVGIMVPLTTLSLRLFVDALQFGKGCQDKIQRIEALQRVQWHMLHRSPFPYLQNNKQLTHYNGNICKFDCELNLVFLTFIR